MYQCTRGDCPASFRYQHLLARHLRSHASVVAGSEVSLETSQSEAFVVSARNLIGLYPVAGPEVLPEFVCLTSLKVFTSKCNLSRHQVDCGSYGVSCLTCRATFKTVRACRTHTYRSIVERTCSCGLSFARTAALLAHRRHCHDVVSVVLIFIYVLC